MVSVAGCAAGPTVLSEGTVVVSFAGSETCGLHNPHEVEARGCRLLDHRAIVCDEFGVIDGVLFSGDCESPASANLLEVRGTSVVMTPVGGNRSAPQ